MKIVVNSQYLLKVLNRVSVAVPQKSMLPIIENFLFSIKEGKLSISGTNLEDSMRVSVSAETDFDNIDIAVPCKVLIDLLKSLPEQPISIFINSDNFSIEIISENGKYLISCENGENYPPIASYENCASVLIDKGSLNRAFDKTLFAVSTDEDRMALNGVYFQFSPQGTTFVATDAHKLVKFVNKDVVSEATISFIIRQKACLLVRKSLEAFDKVTIYYSENNAFFVTDDATIICKLLDAKYPKYEAAIPKDNDKKLYIPKTDLLKMLKRMVVFANKMTHQTAFKFTEKAIHCSAEDLDYNSEANETIKCDYTGEPITIGFNAAFLTECLNNIDTNIVCLEFSTPTKPLCITNEVDYAHESLLIIQMPIMLNN